MKPPAPVVDIVSWEVLQLCSHRVVGWPDAPPGIFGLWSIWRQFQPEVILLAVGWYLRFSLSYRDVEELLAERGVHAGSRHGVAMGPSGTRPNCGGAYAVRSGEIPQGNGPRRRSSSEAFSWAPELNASHFATQSHNMQFHRGAI
jgi:hypothetical protein